MRWSGILDLKVNIRMVRKGGHRQENPADDFSLADGESYVNKRGSFRDKI